MPAGIGAEAEERRRRERRIAGEAADRRSTTAPTPHTCRRWCRAAARRVRRTAAGRRRRTMAQTAAPSRRRFIRSPLRPSRPWGRTIRNTISSDERQRDRMRGPEQPSRRSFQRAPSSRSAEQRAGTRCRGRRARRPRRPCRDRRSMSAARSERSSAISTPAQPAIAAPRPNADRIDRLDVDAHQHGRHHGRVGPRRSRGRPVTCAGSDRAAPVSTSADTIAMSRSTGSTTRTHRDRAKRRLEHQLAVVGLEAIDHRVVEDQVEPEGQRQRHQHRRRDDAVEDHRAGPGSRHRRTAGRRYRARYQGADADALIGAPRQIGRRAR